MAIDVKDRDMTDQAEGPGGAPVPPMRADDHSNASPAVETPVEARQGFLGRPVLMVLGAGLVLAVFAGIMVGLIPI